MNSVQWRMDSRIGELFLVASEWGLQGVFWQGQDVPLVESLDSSAPEVKMLAQGVREIEQYLNGLRKKFEVPLDVAGTPFQKKVWEEVSKIPYGKTLSYGEIADHIKNAKAVRAVGTANAKNPLCIIVPCHRVIASNGSLGGYSGGLKTKDQLLQLERSFVKNPKYRVKTE